MGHKEILQPSSREIKNPLSWSSKNCTNWTKNGKHFGRHSIRSAWTSQTFSKNSTIPMLKVCTVMRWWMRRSRIELVWEEQKSILTRWTKSYPSGTCIVRYTRKFSTRESVSILARTPTQNTTQRLSLVWICVWGSLAIIYIYIHTPASLSLSLSFSLSYLNLFIEIYLLIKTHSSDNNNQFTRFISLSVRQSLSLSLSYSLRIDPIALLWKENERERRKRRRRKKREIWDHTMTTN